MLKGKTREEVTALQNSNNKKQEEYLLHIEDVRKVYGNKVVLADIDLRVRAREFCTVVGPSGCGKSTLLRLILGQERATSGRLLIEGKEIYSPSPDRGIVYQRYSLLTHLTVLENVLVGLQLPLHLWTAFRKKKKLMAEAREYLELVKLHEHADKYPHELSGGMQQRIAIAQALIKKPKILLMDEPFGALDPGTREDMQVLIVKLWEEHNMTIFFVTHDLEEALFLGTRVICLSQIYKLGEKVYADYSLGARVTMDYPVKKGVSPTQIKTTKEFNELKERIRRKGFETDYLADVKRFDLAHDLQHPDSFVTVPTDNNN